MEAPETLQNAIIYFSDPQRCFEYALKLRFPHGVFCPRCASVEHSFIKTRRIWFCKGCKQQFSLKVGTILEDSPLGLDKWMCAFWMICNCKNPISSCEVARAIGVTQKTAWFMLHRIRKAMQGTDDLRSGQKGGPTEVDETFIGGKPKNMHIAKRLKAQAHGEHTEKAIVMGMYDRETRKVRAKLIPAVKREVLMNEILDHVTPGSKVYTDGFKGYKNMDKAQFIHDTVSHITEYVRGDVHTQGIENFWFMLKRTLNGTYVPVEPFHLDSYVDEQVFRFNNRKGLDDQARFELAMGNVFGKRLTYDQLTS